eukprot:GDKH01000210.1.p1 GENE.GDKH01000210.1~~GDKH01000210.1.p1  ORF type:complete len:85 (+),score=11.93 GDKH01000210.1:138-392(+)
MFVPMDWFFRSFPRLCRDKVKFFNLYSLVGIGCGWWMIMGFANPPDFEQYHSTPGFFYRRHLAKKLRKGEITEEKYNEIIHSGH